jgi:anti-anti-sigma regulatory factor
MEFKIDTKDTFTIITPLDGAINAKLAGALEQKCGEMRQSGSKNFIVDLRHGFEIDKTAIQNLVTLHEASYSAEQSLVFTGISEKIMAVIKEEEADLLINIAPRMEEAIDIISMEILERDLFNEE